MEQAIKIITERIEVLRKTWGYYNKYAKEHLQKCEHEAAGQWFEDAQKKADMIDELEKLVKTLTSTK